MKLNNPLKCAPCALTLLTAASFGLVAGAFVLQYGFGAEPCQMCWWQRYMHWAMAAAGTMFLVLRNTRMGLKVISAIAIAGLTIAVWQVLVQQHILDAPHGCGADNVQLATNAKDMLAALSTPTKMPSCEEVSFTMFGLSLAAWNIFAMTAFLAISITSLVKSKHI